MFSRKHVHVFRKIRTCFFSKQFLDETSHSILIVRVLGDAVGIGLDRGLGVGHSDSQSGEPEMLVPLEEKLRQELGKRINVYRSEAFYLELVPKGIDKAASLSRLLVCRRF